MALVSQNCSQELADESDITRNLDSLQFESALSEEEKELTILRKRSHAMTVYACAQATYYITILNEARQIQKQLSNPDARKAARLLQDASQRDPLLVGIIGCGRLGSHLAHCLLSFGEVHPDELKISTRRPETLTELKEKGVKCVHDNARVAKSVHVLFLCILPAHLPQVAEDIQDCVSSTAVIYSFVSAIPSSRLRQLLGCKNILRPQFDWDIALAGAPWDHSIDVMGAFAIDSMLEKTCPLSLHRKESAVTTDETFAEQMVYSIVNVCTQLGLKRKETVDIVNAVVLGHSSKVPLQQRLSDSDITKLKTQDKMFPKFDLAQIVDRATPLTQNLRNNQFIRAAFVHRYCSIFQQYLDWKNQALQLAKKQIHFSFD